LTIAMRPRRDILMDESAYLKCESAGRKAVEQIVFTGERFDPAPPPFIDPRCPIHRP
jgi:hypothetical protein